jgi:outer membrane protein
MRIKTVLLALVTIAGSAVPLAQAEAQAKIAVVNVARLLQEAPQAQSAQQALENEFAARRRDLQNMDRDIKTRRDKLQKDGATMAEAERRNQEKTLRDSEREFARKQGEFADDVQTRAAELRGQVTRSILQEVSTYAKTAGLDVVIPEALYASPSVDITAQVLSALQAKGRAGAPAAKP